TGRRFKRLLPSRVLGELALEMTGLPRWLLEECYGSVGDYAETVALLLDRGAATPAAEDLHLSEWIEQRILKLRTLDEAAQRAAIASWWTDLPQRELYLLNKIITGELRVGVSQTLVVRALAEVSRVPVAVVAHRLMGEWTPTGDFFQSLIAADVGDSDT